MAAAAGGGVRDTPKLKYKLYRKLKVFKKSNFIELTDDNLNLVASSPKYEVVFVASTDGLLAVYRVAELMSQADPPRVTVKLPVEPSHIAVNCDGELLAVLEDDKSILIYNVKDFRRQQDVSPKLSVPRGSWSWVCDMQWSPSMSETLAIGFGDKMTILHAGTGERKDDNSKGVLGCLSWSPSGSSLVVGYDDGTLRVYSPDLSLEKTIPAPAPPLFGEASLEVGAVRWMSNNQFAVIYDNADRRRHESAFTLFNVPEGELPPRAEHVRRLENADTVRPWYRLLEIKPWNVMVCAALRASVKLLPPDSDGGGSRPPVQLLNDFLRLYDEYPVGVALDRVPVLRQSSRSRQHGSSDEMTVLFVLTQTGALATYIVSERPSTPSVDTGNHPQLKQQL